jgi:hypothetical protein
MTSDETLTEKKMDDKFKVFDKVFDKVVKVQDKTFYTKYVKPNQTVVVATLTFITGFVAGYLTKSKSK